MRMISEDHVTLKTGVMILKMLFFQKLVVNFIPNFLANNDFIRVTQGFPAQCHRNSLLAFAVAAIL